MKWLCEPIAGVNVDGTYGNPHGIKNLESHASNKEFLTQLLPPSYGRKSDIDVFGSEFVELMAIYIGINLVLEANWVGQQALEAVSVATVALNWILEKDHRPC
ncbi:hypothetical protein V6N11_044424 [Hibiscus sabdariffa]|uniref:Uncharacterized protein n=1 Tax=Hibiscus sabdariffa TaxID=183260 RepID=A0ABR2RF58_9ROSI